MKEFSKLLMLWFRRLSTEYRPFCLMIRFTCVCILQVFIPIYRGYERSWEFSRYINLSCLKLWFFTLDPFPDLILVLWRTNFKSIPFPKEQRLLQYSCYSCLDLETSAELVVVHFVHCPLSTLMKGASDEICFWWS